MQAATPIRIDPSVAMTTPFLCDDLKHDEGCELVAYQDTLGIWTIGVGHAHVAEGTAWTQAECDAQLAADIAHAEGLLTANASWWRGLSHPRQDVMVNLCFNLGWGDGTKGLSSFKNTLRFIEAGDYADAAKGLLASKWAKQVKSRATRLAAQMETGARVAPT
jgi:lysozyme